MVKNPYTWRISIERWVTNCKNCREWDLEYYLDRFNDHYLSWHEDLIERQHDFFRRGMIVRYEDLLRDTTEVLENVATITGFELSEEIFIPKKVPQSKRFNEIDRAHYLHRPRLPKEEIEIINRHISDEFFKLYNYERIEY